MTKYPHDTALSYKIPTSSFVNDHLNYEQTVNDIVPTCDRKNLLLNPKKIWKVMCFVHVYTEQEGLLSSKLQSVKDMDKGLREHWQLTTDSCMHWRQPDVQLWYIEDIKQSVLHCF